MNRILLVVALGVAGILGLGFFLGWCRVSSESTDARFAVTFSVDWGRVQTDGTKVRDQFPGAEARGTGRAPAPAAPGSAPTGPPLPPPGAGE